MWGSVTVKVPPVSLPLDAAQLRARLRVDETGEDEIDNAENQMLEAFILSGVALVDGPQGSGLAMMRQTWTRIMDAFEPIILLPGSPVVGVAEVRYMDAAGDVRIIPPSDYRLVKGREPAQLVPTVGRSWPSCPSGPGVIEVDYELGAEDAADVPQDLITAVALNAGHLHENREAVAVGVSVAEIPLGVQYILSRHRRQMVAG